jgi:hypothetical protein
LVPAAGITAAALADACYRRDSRAGLLDALRGLPWALRNRCAVPRSVEAQIRKAESPA